MCDFLFMFNKEYDFCGIKVVFIHTWRGAVWKWLKFISLFVLFVCMNVSLSYSILNVYGPVVSRGSTIGSVLHREKRMNEWNVQNKQQGTNRGRNSHMFMGIFSTCSYFNIQAEISTEAVILTAASTSVDSLEEKNFTSW